ncbi:2-oxoisovalerate dehydrogenase subunit beta, partial [Lacticaseibacillus paracasei subsp. paracasei Lpp71]
MAELTYLEAIQQGIDEEMAKDENVLIFGEDVGGDKRRGLWRHERLWAA